MFLERRTQARMPWGRYKQENSFKKISYRPNEFNVTLRGFTAKIKLSNEFQKPNQQRSIFIAICT